MFWFTHWLSKHKSFQAVTVHNTSHSCANHWEKRESKDTDYRLKRRPRMMFVKTNQKSESLSAEQNTELYSCTHVNKSAQRK